MPGKIFVNYRRGNDAAPELKLGAAQALNVAQYLENRFGKSRVFIDIDRLRAGQKFPVVLESKLSECAVMLAVIGPGWLGARDQDTGARRLENPEDWVRLEIERALARDIPVIPVLVGGVALPAKRDLPPSLQPLLDHQIASISHSGFPVEMAGLARDVEALMGRRPWGLIASAGLAVLAGCYVMAHQLGVPVPFPDAATDPAEVSPKKQSDKETLENPKRQREIVALAHDNKSQDRSKQNAPEVLLDKKWQQTAHWPVIKREFPDWYKDRLRLAVQLASESKPDDEINKVLVDQLITLRRQNSALALAASTPKLQALATAFVANLRELKSQSTMACFNFISQSEGTAGVIEQFQIMDGTKSAMQLQVAAIFDAIGDGRKSPVAHEKPIKPDYDALMDQLGKLGWSQADVATFADPKALAKAEPARVCQMVQDWFVAHISITDEAAQERLLGETLRPVVSG